MAQDTRGTEALEKIREALTQRSTDIGLGITSLTGLVSTAKQLQEDVAQNLEEVVALVETQESRFEDPLEEMKDALDDFSSAVDQSAKDIEDAASTTQESLQELVETTQTIDSNSIEEAFADLTRDHEEAEAATVETHQEVVDQHAKLLKQVTDTITELKDLKNVWTDEAKTLGAWGGEGYDGTGSQRKEKFDELVAAVGSAKGAMTEAKTEWLEKVNTTEDGAESLYGIFEAAMVKQTDDVIEVLEAIKTDVETEKYTQLDISETLLSSVTHRWTTNSAVLYAEYYALPGLVATIYVASLTLPTTLIVLKGARVAAEALGSIADAINPFD